MRTIGLPSLFALFFLALNAAQAQGPVVALELEDSVVEVTPPRSLLDSQRLNHARELLGRYYDHSVVRAGETIASIRKFVSESVAKGLPSAYQGKKATLVSKTILEESKRHGFDPVFIMAVIENESSFNPKARGPVGEIGLMQLRPDTARWIAQKNKIQWKGKKSLEDPVINIRIGAAYLSYLREKLDSHGRLYLSAYNMGVGGVKSALDRDIWPKDYVARVMQRYIRFYQEIRDGGTGTEARAPAAQAGKRAIHSSSERTKRVYGG